MSEQQILSQLSVDNIRRHVRHIVDGMPSRLAGTPNAQRMAEYSAAELRAAGLEARIEAIPGLVSFPREALLAILSPQPRAIPANTFGHSVQTAPEGVCGDLVYVGSGHFADYEGKDVAGKITLFGVGRRTPHPYGGALSHLASRSGPDGPPGGPTVAEGGSERGVYRVSRRVAHHI